jgi:ABC-type nickel/cobalt efflux system permease component RcnA
MSWSHSISRLLLLVLGLTVLSPHFGWEVMAANVHHDLDGAGLVLGESHDHGDSHPLNDHHDEHACGGHMFNHMPVQLSSPVTPSLLVVRDAFAQPSDCPCASRDPDLPERPPRLRLA